MSPQRLRTLLHLAACVLCGAAIALGVVELMVLGMWLYP